MDTHHVRAGWSQKTRVHMLGFYLLSHPKFLRNIVSAMDIIIDNVLLIYVSYGLVLTSRKPEVLRAVSATFSEKEVADAKDVLWTQ